MHISPLSAETSQRKSTKQRENNLLRFNDYMQPFYMYYEASFHYIAKLQKWRISSLIFVNVRKIPTGLNPAKLDMFKMAPFVFSRCGMAVLDIMNTERTSTL